VRAGIPVPDEGSSLIHNVYDDHHEDTRILPALYTLYAIFYIMKLHYYVKIER
jgi:hypothetical protein